MAWEKVIDIVGPPGTVDEITVETIPAGQTPSATVGGTPANRTAHFRLERGLPGTNAVANDTAFATYLGVPDSQTRGAFSSAFTSEVLGAGKPAINDAITRQTRMYLASGEQYPGIDESGATPSQDGINAMLASVPYGARVLFRGSYYFTGGIEFDPKKNLILDWHGASIKVDTGSYQESVFLYGRQDFESQELVSAISTALVDIEDVTGVAATRMTVPGLASMPEALKWKRFDVIKVFADDTIPGGHYTSNTLRPRVGEFAQVHSVEGDVLTLRNVLRETYTTRTRVARLPYGSVQIVGGMWDVSDEMVASNTTINMIRLRGLTNPVVDSPHLRRVTGMGISMKSCAGYLIKDVRADFAMNNISSGVYGYGIHDSSCNDGIITGGHFRSLRHAYTDGTNFSAAPADYRDSDPADFGSTINTLIQGVVARDCSSAAFDTHSMAYGVRFLGCTAYAQSQTNGFQLRGRACEVRDGTVYGAYAGLFMFTQATTSGGAVWSPGSSHRHYISNLRVVDSVVGISVTLHDAPTHPKYDQVESEMTAIVNGLVCDGTQKIAQTRNARIRWDNVYWRAPRTLGGSVWSLQNSWIDARNVMYDASAVDSISSTAYLANLDSPLSGRTFSSTVRLRDQRLTASPAFRSGVSTLFNATNSSTRRIESTGFEYEEDWGGTGNFLDAHFSVDRAVSWSIPFLNASPTTSSRSSSGMTFSHATISNASELRKLTNATDAHLVATANLEIGSGATMPALPFGRKEGQELTIVIGVAQSGSSLTIQNGTSFNTRLQGGVNKILTGGNARCDLVWSQGAWRELA